MKLSRLEIYGFKSFPQKTDIRFDEGITGIVGPNGSGKSNIADAVRWVLGEQSARALRGARMEDVIFSGTQKRRLMPYCEVSLVFDNQDGKLRSDRAEVMVTRRAYRTGEGEYFLNQKNCRLKDIVELFQDTGVGREGYSIIGQGHIDVILSGKGEERRAAFEEAAGISGFRSRKEEAERKLERAQEYLSRAGDLLGELGSRLEPLQAQADAARAYLRLSEQLRSLDANIFLSRHGRVSRRLAGLTESLQSLAEQVRAHEADIARLQEERRRAEEEITAAEALEGRAQEEQRRQEDALNGHLLRAQRADDALLAAREEAQRKEAEARDAKREAEGVLAVLEAARAEGEQGSQMVRQADRLLKEAEAAAGAAQGIREAAEQALEEHRALVLKIANSRSDARENQARRRAMLEQAEGRLAEIQGGLAAMASALALRQAEEREAEVRLQKTRGIAEALKTEAKRLEDEAGQARRQAREAQDAHHAAENGLRQAQARLTALRETASSHEGYGQPVRQAMARAKGNPAVHGTVAELIRVPRDMETAIEMALGGALQHIVTRDEETAKELIDYLRENRFGRATFLPVSAVQPRALNPRERQALSHPACLGVASELVDCAPAFSRVVDSLLGRTAVVRDLDSGIAVSRAGGQAFNVVTLLGDVLRAGGAMTGGSVRERAVSLLGREREIGELAAAVSEGEKTLLALQAAQEEAAVRFEALVAQSAQANRNAQEEEIAVARDEESLSRSGENARQAAERLAQAEAAQGQLQDMMAELREDLAQADAASAQLDQGHQRTEEEGEALRLAFLEARQGEEAARSALEERREARTQLAHRLDVSARDAARLEKEHRQQAGRGERLEKEAARLREGIARDAQAREGLTAQEAALREAAKEAAGKAQDAQERRRALAQRQKQAMDLSEQAHARHAEDAQRLHKGELSAARLEEELQAMAAQLWNNHELTYALAEELRAKEGFELPRGEREAAEIRKEIREMGAINVHALEEYAATRTRYDDLSAQRGDAEKAREDLLALIRKLKGQMERQFARELELLNQHFKETFRRLFSGGQASLELSDPDNPLDCDVNIKAQPPGKKLQLLSLLSGGERALTAIAILFAMLRLKPTPFCVLDEIEAALDDANISSFADFLSEFARDTQFIVITHRKGTMERCDALYGVTMREKGVSDMISVSLQEYPA